MGTLVGAITFLSISVLSLVLPYLVTYIGRLVGWHLRRKTASRRNLLLKRSQEEQAEHSRTRGQAQREGPKSASAKASQIKTNKNWCGIIGFFHPFWYESLVARVYTRAKMSCSNAGGGGERVLWAAIRATQQTWPKALCVVYTGDHNVTKEDIIKQVKSGFNIQLHPPNLALLYLSNRKYVLSTTWPRFTLLGQSFGSLILAFDALSLLPPDIFIDTMGYAFALAFAKLLLPTVPTAAYVHYPTISTDMLSSLNDVTNENTQTTTRGLNAGSGAGIRGFLKRQYWRLFAWLYAQVGASIDVVMTNSSWTQSHIMALWGPNRSRRTGCLPSSVVFPPVAVGELERAIELSDVSEAQREPMLLYIAQFRPEKNHALVLGSFASFLTKLKSSASQPNSLPQLVLLGSVRNSADETLVYSLRLLAHELHITASVSFVLNASWPDILAHLRTAHVGVNAMWNEHFGIGVVEYQAAGLLCVVNDSGGPRADIVKDLGEGETGWRAETQADYAAAFEKAFNVRGKEATDWRLRARKSAERFGEDVFEAGWMAKVELLMKRQTDLQNQC